MIGKTISHYKIIEKLGSGGMGDVYKAEDTKLQRTVALKFLPPSFIRNEEARKRFVHEARTASALDHPNIGTVFEIDESDDNFFIAMAFYEGETLQKKIERGPIDVGEALNIVIQIMKGLDKAHSENIFHRDIKPSNIILTNDGQVKIIDFGLAKLMGNTLLTKKGSTMGSVAYMSPEQTEGEKVDFRTDIWSVGVVLYEMLAGKRPFSAEYEQAVMYQIMNENPEFITKIRSDVPLEVENVLERSLAKKPHDRYKDIGDMLKELQITADEHKKGLTNKSFVYRIGRKQRKQIFRSIIPITIIIIIGIYLWFDNIKGTEPVSILLLPLVSMINDTENDWFTDGMTDALITDLAKIKGLQVISRSSAMQYKGTSKTLKEIGAELGVDYIIEGSVARVEDQIKITTRLLNAINDRYLWGEEYEREFKNVLGLQGEIAQTIAKQIEVELTPLEETELSSTRIVNPKTYELYLKGMYHINKYTPEGFQKGFSYLNEAVEIDSEDPLPHAALAVAYGILAHTPAPPPNAAAMARSEAQRALELDKNIAEVYLTQGMISEYQDWDQPEAEKNIKRALELNPNLALAYAHLAFNHLITGNNEKALAGAKKSQQLDPLVPLYPAWHGWIYYWMERHDEAILEASKSIELLPNFPIGLYVIGCAQAAKGNFEEAIEAHQKAGEIDPSWKWALGQTYALAGRNDEAQQIASELENKGSHWDAWGIAEIYAALGKNEKSLDWLEKAFEQKHPYSLWLTSNFNFDILKNESRYKALVQKLIIPDLK